MNWLCKVYEGCIELGCDYKLDENLRTRIIFLDIEKDVNQMSEDIDMIGIVYKDIDNDEKKFIEILSRDDCIDISYCDGLYSLYLERMIMMVG